MAATTIMLTKFTEWPVSAQHPDGGFDIVYALNGNGGYGMNWSSRQAMLDETINKLADTDHAVMFLLGYWFGRDPNFSNPNVVLNKMLTIDFSAQNPIKLQ